MAFRDFLLALTTYPNPTSQASVADAVAVAAAFDARLAAIACDVRMKIPRSVFGNALLDVGALAAAEEEKSAERASSLLAAFDAEARRQGITSEAIREKCFTGEVPGLLVEYARLRDMTILPVRQGDDYDQWYAESILFGSGRPALVLPHEWKRRTPVRLETAVIAWDFSRCAARAVADALPALQKARNVHVVTVANEKDIDTRRSASEIAKHLAHHGVVVTVDEVDAAGRDIGTTLTAFCASRDADLLVMGAYGHSRLRDFVLGGATRSLLSNPSLPVLMSH